MYNFHLFSEVVHHFNFQAAHNRNLEQTQLRHQSELQTANDKFREIQQKQLENLERQNEQETEDRARHLKRKQESYLSELQSTILNQNLDYEAKKLANQNLSEELEKEEIRLAEREAVMKKKMQDLETGFTNLKNKQEKDMQENLVDLTTRKENLERDVMKLTSEKEHIQREKNRLEIERTELETSIRQLKEEQLRVRHETEVLLMRDAQTKLVSEHEKNKDHLLEQMKMTIGRTRSDSGANSMQIFNHASYHYFNNFIIH